MVLRRLLKGRHKFFERMGVPVVQAEADSGNIGGSFSHEFHIPSSAGSVSTGVLWL